ncbi:ferredoxin reductase family protein [Aliamphritea spongicola]|uniref:ferredoxin reductase family protein n=1 Tax=Aliamphritea spongicola TaxID=707589 RepID=UPI00196AD572|nr:ferric reductase-like transmembrane domain-containing protein [Aliamphritea spongicola]MBN3564918.1 ferric reductase-like transmembrane domain-containing protein [Aliamphritea spongicola]
MLKRSLFVVGFIGLHLGVLYHSVPAENLLAALTGSIALSCMALSVCLAARWRWLDALCGGPDRSYRVHRWLGYGALTGTVLHWPLAEDGLEGAVPILADVAGESGEFAAISLLTLAAVSALKLVPYHWWKKSHFLMGPVYLITVFHSLFSALPFSADSHAWLAMLGVSLLGTVGWLATLLRRSGSKVEATVVALNKTSGRTDVTLQVPADFGWKPGQFVNLAVKRPGLDEYHPFSFASAKGKGTARFIINAAGDFTRQLHKDLSLGDKVLLKEVAGRFQPKTGADRQAQVWAAAGVGITPFLASLDAMSADSGANIDLLYCCDARSDASLLHELRAHEERLPQFTLHVFTSGQRLNAASLNSMPECWWKADLYICGPASLKKMLISLWRKRAPEYRVYHEDFDFRSAINLPSVPHRLMSVCMHRISRYIKGQINAYSRT